jgi:nucleotidyltransferase substrate binding protein (TIGR01987 family)
MDDAALEHEGRLVVVSDRSLLYNVQMALALGSFRKAISSLRQTLSVAAEMAALRPEDEALANALRSGVIQNIEFTYALSWKFAKRWLEANVGPTYVDGVTRRELFRLAAENKLIDDVESWMSFHAARNAMSHTYDASVARDVALIAPALLAEAEKLLSAIEHRNA